MIRCRPWVCAAVALGFLGLAVCCVAVPIESITGLPKRAINTLTDNNPNTGIALLEGTYAISRKSTEAIIFVSLHITAQAAGSAELRFGDTMPIPVAYTAGSKEYRVRVPCSRSKSVSIVWGSDGATLSEIHLIGRTPLPESVAGKNIKAIAVSLGSDYSPSSDHVGFMCGFFEHGIVDGLTVHGTRAEFIKRLKEFGAQSLRFPGGTFSYAYPYSRDALPAYREAASDQQSHGLKECYGLTHPEFGYASPGEYFQFCKDAGLVAWFQVNPGYYYDRAKNAVVKTVSNDLHNDGYTGDYTAGAVAGAQDLVKLARKIGVPTIWEVGNEDYCYYKPETYARLCKAFLDGIRKIDPNARIAICGDNGDWSNDHWSSGLSKALADLNVKNIDYSSQHLYSYGVGYYVGTEWHPWDTTTAQGLGDCTAAAWHVIGPYERNLTERFNKANMGPTKMAITEFNPIAGGWNGTSEVDNSVGRGLGEAQAVCNMMQDGASLFFHDLVRNDFRSLFFNRLDYYPSNPVGRRYHWFAQASAVSLVVPHGRGRIVYNNAVDGTCVSRHKGFAYITVINRSAKACTYNVDIKGAAIDRHKRIESRVFRASSPECCFFDYYTDRLETLPPASGRIVKIESAPYSVVAVTAYLK